MIVENSVRQIVTLIQRLLNERRITKNLATSIHEVFKQ